MLTLHLQITDAHGIDEETSYGCIDTIDFREFGNGDSDLDADHFRVLIDTAVGQLLGVAAPPYSFGGYDERTQKGSILVAQKDLNLFWGALSLYGRHLDERIALHMNSVSLFPSEYCSRQERTYLTTTDRVV